MKRSYEHHKTNESTLLNVELQITYIHNKYLKNSMALFFLPVRPMPSNSHECVDYIISPSLNCKLNKRVDHPKV